jgi:hypothetical protein
MGFLSSENKTVVFVNDIVVMETQFFFAVDMDAKLVQLPSLWTTSASFVRWGEIKF